MADMNTFTEGMMPGPDGCILRFFYDTERNEQATIAEGRAIFDTVLSVDVITPGQKASTPRFELERTWSEQSKKALGLQTVSKKSYKYGEYAEQIERFKKQEDIGDLGGTPLKEWPRIDRGLAATLMAANVYTVEALAALSDTNLDIIGMGARELRENAKAFLEQAAGNSDTSALTAKVGVLEGEVARLREELAVANSTNEELLRKAGATAPAAAPSGLPDITLG
jgi:hypothetical protein